MMRSSMAVMAFAALMAGCTNSETEPVEAAEAVAEPVITGATPDFNPNRNAYFGEMHVHTRNSFDAYIFNVRRGPDDAYAFAKGETITHPAGYDLTIAGDPLDFIGVTDHAEYLGILPAMNTPENPLSELEISKSMFSTDRQAITDAFQKVGATVRSGEPIEEIYDRGTINSVWAETVAAADRHYEPGTLTTFAAYEYTAVTTRADDGTFGGGNLHRNVFFRDKAPDRAFSTLDSKNPEDLWDWMDEQRAAGMDAIAIPHNSNVSDGRMFALDTYDGLPLTAEHATQRMRNEPVVEITQVKGTSETHPELSPNDEWADFEIYEELLGVHIKSVTSGGYVREALARGLVMQDEEGFNPFKFGFVAASDSHVAGGAFDESDYWSKVGIVDGLPRFRGSVPPGGQKTWEGVEPDENAEGWFSKWSASGLAGVWAEENTREAIFDAMRRKETFATSGTRIRARLFAGYGYPDNVLDDPDLLDIAYANGVPMGGDLAAQTEGAPAFLAWAMRDPRGAPLDRLQIVKVWSDGGVARETVYDAACSDGAEPDAETYRCPDNGASVDLADCSISAEAGDPELRVRWSDPEFDASHRAAYYVRVLENPTCRWSTWDALKTGAERNPRLPATIQERAWTSPVWIAPTR
ncbi:MAG: DUF3604 domain-containing protein [Pseudomonadota bacterium]